MSQTFIQEGERITRAWVIAVMAAFTLIAVVLTIAAVGMLQARRRNRPLAEGIASKPTPVAEVSNVRTELFERAGAGAQLKQRQHAEISKFRWVDKPHGIVAIPIDVAIQVVASEQQ